MQTYTNTQYKGNMGKLLRKYGKIMGKNRGKRVWGKYEDEIGKVWTKVFGKVWERKGIISVSF